MDLLTPLLPNPDPDDWSKRVSVRRAAIPQLYPTLCDGVCLTSAVRRDAGISTNAVVPSDAAEWITWHRTRPSSKDTLYNECMIKNQISRVRFSRSEGRIGRGGVCGIDRQIRITSDVTVSLSADTARRSMYPGRGGGGQIYLTTL